MDVKNKKKLLTHCLPRPPNPSILEGFVPFGASLEKNLQRSTFKTVMLQFQPASLCDLEEKFLEKTWAQGVIQQRNMAVQVFGHWSRKKNVYESFEFVCTWLSNPQDDSY